MRKIIIGVMGPGENATHTDIENAFRSGMKRSFDNELLSNWEKCFGLVVKSDTLFPL